MGKENPRAIPLSEQISDARYAADTALADGNHESVLELRDHTNPVVRDGVWRFIIDHLGSNLKVAVPALVFGGIAVYIGSVEARKALAERAGRQLEEIMQNPYSVEPRRARQVWEKAIAVNRGHEFTDNLFSSADRYPKRAVAKFWEEVDPHSSVFSSLLTEETGKNHKVKPMLDHRYWTKLLGINPELAKDMTATIIRKLRLRTPEDLRGLSPIRHKEKDTSTTTVNP